MDKAHTLAHMEGQQLWTNLCKANEEIKRLTAEVSRKDEALSTCQQALLEVAHAQQCGSGWYTKGESGLRRQVDMWVRRGSEAIREALDADSGSQEPEGDYCLHSWIQEDGNNRCKYCKMWQFGLPDNSSTG